MAALRPPLPSSACLRAGLLALALLLAACGEDEAPRPRTRPAALAGVYGASAEHFVAEVREAMRLDHETTRGPIEAGEAGDAVRARIDEASARWAAALANDLELQPDGSATWRVLEPYSDAGSRAVDLVDLVPPSVPALYEGTWWQEEPGEVRLTLERRNGKPLRWPQTSTLRVREDGGLDVPWLRDHDLSVEEQPLLRR